MRNHVIAALLRASRPDLANVVAYQTTAKLILPPRDLKRFVGKLIKRMRDIDALAKRLEDRFNNLDRTFRAKDGSEYNPTEDFRVMDRQGYGGPYGIGGLRDVFEKFHQTGADSLSGRAEEIEQTFKWAMDSKSPREQLDNIGYIASSLGFFVERMHDWGVQDFAENPKWVKDSYEAYVNQGYTPSEYPVLLERRDLEDFNKLAVEYLKLKRDLKDAAVRIAHIKSAAYNRYNDHSWQPESEETETLYHASIDAKTIFRRKAFEQRVPEAKGLGGSQGDRRGKPAISFTSDLYVAKEIMRTLKEAIMIAQGNLKAHQIYDWSHRAGIYDDVVRNFESNYGKFDPKKPVHTFNLYRLYLTFSKRYDPLFFGDMERLLKTFKKSKVSDVGVLVCTVNMKHPDNAYLGAMHEYRVPPSAVVSVDKLIR